MNRLFGLNGILGLLLLVVVLLSVVALLGFQAWKTQKAQVSHHYTLDFQAIQANDSKNMQYYRNVK